MTPLNSLAGIGLSLYIIAVVWYGNTSRLLALGIRDVAFVQWAFAVAFLYYLYQIKSVRNIFGPILLMGLLAFFMLNLNKIKANATTFWTSLGSTNNGTSR